MIVRSFLAPNSEFVCCITENRASVVENRANHLSTFFRSSEDCTNPPSCP